MANFTHNMTPSQRLTVSSLLSPPEMKRSESFGSSIAPSSAQSSFSPFNSTSASSAMKSNMASYQAVGYASPPISPYNSQVQKENMGDMEEQGSRDPQLFVSGDAATSMALDVPLFPQESAEAASQHVITEHMKSPGYAKLQSKPVREDYELAVFVQSTVFEQYVKSPSTWWARERSYDAHYSQASRVEKRHALKKLAPAPSARPRQPKVALARLPPRTPRAPKAKRTPQSHVLNSFDATPTTASPKPVRLATNRDDTDYNALPNFCPPLNTLPKGNNKVLKAEWKGTVLDLSNDVDRHLLHEAELHLAATLRLNCATYLCSKRRVFQARVETLKIGKEFRKTDAQQACKIDVNKASKLWQAYDKVGWFNAEHFRQYL
ncbi:hypothetical protein P153DRAFT_386278 [Dothidotthia symphoricarpi CBS 119687]|uniref:SWIRM domain-containing protein n=1 Tax=Dothidotthia symphoricarpi CBS 119687 TaxID=1392245 RepID=A0A6A6ABD7_9PLEO|nr:uncharacterized protein P153DRAFT_386278 [Dothidotthia symphoricarpi CBS 119687]KAF2129089.1 hypothetical protein P153DRAFT_386278 [Dothidotthia symphoricarpi CBS 119687]